MKRLGTAIAVLAIVIPLQGAIAGAGDTSGTEVAFYDPASSSWQVPGGDSFYYGAPGDTPLLCDWDGDGVATVGVYRESTGYLLLHDSNSTGAAAYEFFYGIPGDRPLCGDWDGDGVDTIGIFRPSEEKFYLRNANSQGFGDWAYQFGFATGVPFAGDFSGDNKDTVGIRDPKTGFVSIARSHFTDSAVLESYFGSSADTLVVGDWDGDGIDRLAVYQPATHTLAVTNLFGSTKVAEVYDLGSVAGIPLAAEFNPASGVHTTHPEYTGSPLTGVVGAPQPPAQEPPPAEEPPPATVAPTTTTTAPAPAPAAGAVLAVDYFGVPWTMGDIGAERVQGIRSYWNSVVVPYDGEIASLKKYMVGNDGGYGAGTGGSVYIEAHRDDNGRPGAVVARTQTVDGGPIRVREAGSFVGFQANVFDNPVTVTRGERIWFSYSNPDSNPTANWISMDEGNNHYRWAGLAGGPLAVGEPLGPLNPTDRQMVAYYEDLRKIENRVLILTLDYADGRSWGNGYVSARPYAPRGEVVRVGGSNQIRQRFTPPQDTTIVDELWLRIMRQSGPGDLTATLREVGGSEVFSLSAPASQWPQGGWGVDYDWGASTNATWGKWAIPTLTLRAGVEYELIISTPPGTEYHATGLRYGSGYMPGGFLDAPGAEETANGGSTWTVWLDHTAQLSFFFRTQ